MENLQTSLPGWEIVRCIGSGSSGKVYELKKKKMNTAATFTVRSRS